MAKAATHSKTWQLQEAKNKLSEVLKRAMHEGPQHITLQGRPAGVLLSEEEFVKLGGEPLVEVKRIQTGKELIEWFRKSAFYGVKLDLRRSKEPVSDTRLFEDE